MNGFEKVKKEKLLKGRVDSLKEIKSLLLTHLILRHVAVSSPTKSVSVCVLLGPFSLGL